MSVLDLEFPKETEVKITMVHLCKELNRDSLMRYNYCEFYNPVIVNQEGNRVLEKTTYDPNKKWYLWVYKSFDLEGDVYQLFFLPTIKLGPEFNKYSLKTAFHEISENVRGRVSLDELIEGDININNIKFL
jgi:hypothetical protein